MKVKRAKTRKGAASIYVVIFTTTLLSIIALSFVRIMLAESMRTTNYSLSQSAYNSALAGVEDAKIVLLRYQSCINKESYTSGGNKTGSCAKYIDLFGSENDAYKTSQNCNAVGSLLHGTKDSDIETLIQTQDGTDTGTIDQAYTCVKIAAYTEDFIASLNSKNPTKLIPLRSDGDEAQKTINRIQVQWFDEQNYRELLDGNENLKDEYTGFWKNGNKGELTGTLVSNVGDYAKSTAADFGNSFTEKSLVPPVIQVSMIQSANSFTMNDFYASEGIGPTSKTDRGTLTLRPTRSKNAAFLTKLGITNSNKSNMLPQSSLAYSANKSFNTPIDVACDPGNSSWGSYACSADFFVPAPIGANYVSDSTGHKLTATERNLSTSFLVVNLPYGGPQTDISVKMLSCEDPSLAINAEVPTSNSNTKANCEIVYFANVQPMVDSTGRANDLFRRVESRIELADTNFPIANYALAMTDPTNTAGIAKDFYVTHDCEYSSTTFANGDVVNVNGKTSTASADGTKTDNSKRCPDSRVNRGGASPNGE